VLSRLEDAFRLSIPLPLLFEKPVLTDIAERLTRIQQEVLAELLAKRETISEEEAEHLLGDGV
jgi:hypothetical protein